MTTLSDADIIAEMQGGQLIRNGDDGQVAGACYELRLGDVYYDLTESDKPIQVTGDQKILIKPGHRVVLITNEELQVPNNVLARIVSKGSLFSIGLSPVATYADPGFSGNMGIVTQNISDRYIMLPQGESIAKADFTRLTGNVCRPYSGQHGFKTRIWPIKHQLQKSHSEVMDDPRVGTEKDESYRLLPKATENVLRTLEVRQYSIDGAILVAVVLNALAVFLVGNNIVGSFIGLISSLVASLAASVIVVLVMFYAKGKK